MNHVIIGTAGHVDHGKTCLIKALTGIDTDRLEEEKKRGITIELGFAYLDLPDGNRAGIIDVPGHERFIKNMLAGAGGIDLALLVIAADEGMMPQTREHLGILSMLDIRSGVVVLTKSDLVAADWLEFVADDIRSELKHTFLQDAPILPVSSCTGEGIDALRQELVRLVQTVRPKEAARSFRIPVDRVFTVKGFGTVVTGTLIEGTLCVGDPVELYPGGGVSKVRNLQVHGRDVDTAEAGQRVAVNLAAMKKDEVQRGDTLAQPGSMEPTMMLDVKLNLFRDTPRTVENGSVLHLYVGTRNVLCKAVLLDRDELKAGESCMAQLRLNETIALKNGDRYVVRFYSPIETIGGGEVLDANPAKQKRFQEDAIRRLATRETGTLTERMLLTILECSPKFTPLDTIGKRLLLSGSALQEELAKVSDPSLLVKVNDRIVVHKEYMLNLRSQLEVILKEYHEKNPLQSGMRLDELKQRLLPECEPAVADAVLDWFVGERAIRIEGQRAALEPFRVCMNDAQQRLMEQIEQLYLDAGFSVSDLDELLPQFQSSGGAFRQVHQAMVDRNILINITAQMYLHKVHFLRALDEMEKLQEENGEISLGAFRDRLATSRKYALPLLTFCDNKKITKRSGDLRRLDALNLQKFRAML